MAKQRPEASRPKQARALKTEQTLLDALEKLLAQKSFADVTVSELALEAGVTTGAIYRRFVDKEDVLRAACQRFIERPQMHDVDFADDLTDQQLLHEYFRGLMSYMLRNAHIMRAANYLNDIESFDHMNTARAASADWLAARIRTSNLSTKELDKRCRFVLRIATATFRDTFLTGRGATLSEAETRSKFEDKLDRLCQNLATMACSYLETAD